MKNILLVFFLTSIFSCSQKKEEEVNEIVVDSDSLTNNLSESGTLISNPATRLYVWRATADYQKEKNPGVDKMVLPVDSLIKGLNEYYPEVFLEKKKQSGDTLYTEIKNSEYLTQRMGSTGAEIYVADVILNLTTVAGIKYVKIDFDEGDHAGPGVWSAENFKTYKEKKP